VFCIGGDEARIEAPGADDEAQGCEVAQIAEAEEITPVAGC